MKKFISSILITVLVFSMVGCASSSNSNEEEVIADDEEQEEQEEYSEFTWPKSDIAALLPVPKSNIGKIEWEASYGFVIYVAETSKTDYDEYVSECQDCGFTIDYNKGDDYFYAYNEDGYYLSLKYQDGDVMFIRIDEPKEEEPEEEEPEEEETAEPEEDSNDSSKENESKKNADGVDEDFKEVMDSYEEFFDEYVAFMKKYNDADDIDSLSMLADMTNYLSEYTDMMEKLDSIDENSLSAADLAYYTEVLGRINKKLAELY